MGRCPHGSFRGVSGGVRGTKCVHGADSLTHRASSASWRGRRRPTDSSRRRRIASPSVGRLATANNRTHVGPILRRRRRRQISTNDLDDESCPPSPGLSDHAPSVSAAGHLPPTRDRCPLSPEIYRRGYNNYEPWLALGSLGLWVKVCSWG